MRPTIPGSVESSLRLWVSQTHPLNALRVAGWHTGKSYSVLLRVERLQLQYRSLRAQKTAKRNSDITTQALCLNGSQSCPNMPTRNNTNKLQCTCPGPFPPTLALCIVSHHALRVRPALTILRNPGPPPGMICSFGTGGSSSLRDPQTVSRTQASFFAAMFL